MITRAWQLYCPRIMEVHILVPLFYEAILDILRGSHKLRSWIAIHGEYMSAVVYCSVCDQTTGRSHRGMADDHQLQPG